MEDEAAECGASFASRDIVNMFDEDQYDADGLV
jgi:hypothetical protein